MGYTGRDRGRQENRRVKVLPLRLQAQRQRGDPSQQAGRRGEPLS